MNELIQFISTLLIIIGIIFFALGVIGLVRFPDLYSRLHAITKADNIGLGFIVFGLMLNADSIWVAGKLFLIWLLVVVASCSASFIIAQFSYQHDKQPWVKS